MHLAAIKVTSMHLAATNINGKKEGAIMMKSSNIEEYINDDYHDISFGLHDNIKWQTQAHNQTYKLFYCHGNLKLQPLIKPFFLFLMFMSLNIYDQLIHKANFPF